MQAVCDHNLMIRDVFIGYPGSVHDARVYRTSSLSNTLVEKCGNYYILGDSAYPCLRNLLTPYKDTGNLNRAQMVYNRKHAKSRYVIEHCFGVLKQKWRQLYHLKIKNIEQITHFVRACCVLHNIAIKYEFNHYETEEAAHGHQLLNIDLPPEEDEGDDDGFTYRNFITNRIVEI